MSGGLNPNAESFEWNVGASDFVPYDDPVPEPSYYPTYIAQRTYPASYSYNPPPGIKCDLSQGSYFYY